MQAQATRMVSAISNAIAEFDPNPDRQAWLRAVSDQYEAYRDQIIAIINKYLSRAGEDQE